MKPHNFDLSRWPRRSGHPATRTVTLVLLAVLLVALSMAPAFGATLAADPASVTITSFDQSVVIKLTADGKLVPASAIKGVRFLVDDHDYRRMISVSKGAGELLLTPTSALEVGSYTLAISTTLGEVTVEVLAPLTDLPDMLEKRAARQGITVEELRKRMGLSKKLPRETLELNLPPVHYEGQTLQIALEANPARAFTWSVNGKIVTEGVGQNEFSYPLKEPGQVKVSVLEKEGGRVIASAEAATTVAAWPATPWEVTVGARASVAGPAGYAKYTWTLDGAPVSTKSEFRHVFQHPGKYEIECKAEQPSDPALGEFAKVRYAITVTPRKKL